MVKLHGLAVIRSVYTEVGKFMQLDVFEIVMLGEHRPQLIALML